MKPSARLRALRDRMAARGVAGYLVPATDPHGSEYVPLHWQRRQWLTGFTGSAGDALVLAGSAGLWTDGRYFIQAERELKRSGFTLFRHGRPNVPTLGEHLKARMRAGEALGVDPRVVTRRRALNLEAALVSVGGRLEFIDENLVDAIWQDRPSPPVRDVRTLPRNVTGASSARKLGEVRRAMRRSRVSALVIPTLDDIAWLFNIRGRDVEFNPLVIAYAIVTLEGASLFVDSRKIPESVARVVGKRASLRGYEEIETACRTLGSGRARVWVDESSTSAWIFSCLEGCKFETTPTPIPRLKARKNDVEIQGAKNAHVRDGVAMVRFLQWLEGASRNGGLTESSAADRLERFRAEGDRFEGPSFGTISGYGAHGAIVHYSVTPETDVPVRPRGLYLVDSGAHYTDGTTDITRTVLLGKRATKAQREQFTRVLKGHIALANAVFSEGVDGVRLDTLARLPLWQAGLDYGHGTGHGVGSFMNVHEGPQAIGTRATGAPLEPGNILSNEPGYYVEGEYGIRIENLVVVVDDPSRSTNGTRFHRFETISLCPIDTRLIELGLLDRDERRWLNDYHRRVKREIAPHLERDVARWLVRACAPI